MRHWLIVLCLLLAPLVSATPARALAAPPITVTNDSARVLFPARLTFSADLAGSAPITAVTLEYSVDEQTCGVVLAKAVPSFKPAKNVKVSWTWAMKDSGSLAPGVQVRWQWRVTDANGAQLLTDRRGVTWLDDRHSWHTLSSRQVNVHWYSGGQAFGLRMQNAALAALSTISQKLNLQPDQPIDLYLYADADEMQQAVYYRPDWAGGIAYPKNRIAIAGVAPTDDAWGRRVVAHEIAHVVVDRYGFSCLGARPTWLDEGLATYIEGGPTQDEQAQFETAVHDNDLIALSALDDGFTQDDYTVSLAYTESFSVVDFMVVRYGSAKLLSVIRKLADGSATSAALQAVYGLDQIGLENAWRAQVGAKPHALNPAPTGRLAWGVGGTDEPEF